MNTFNYPTLVPDESSYDAMREAMAKVVRSMPRMAAGVVVREGLREKFVSEVGGASQISGMRIYFDAKQEQDSVVFYDAELLKLYLARNDSREGMREYLEKLVALSSPLFKNPFETVPSGL